MTAFVLYALTGAALFTLGFLRIVTVRNLLRQLLALNVMGSGVFVILVATAHRGGGEHPDPVPHAMVLTGIVVAVSITAFALILIRRIHAASGRGDLGREEG